MANWWILMVIEWSKMVSDEVILVSPTPVDVLSVNCLINKENDEKLTFVALKLIFFLHAISNKGYQLLDYFWILFMLLICPCCFSCHWLYPQLLLLILSNQVHWVSKTTFWRQSFRSLFLEQIFEGVKNLYSLLIPLSENHKLEFKFNLASSAFYQNLYLNPF